MQGARAEVTGTELYLTGCVFACVFRVRPGSDNSALGCRGRASPSPVAPPPHPCPSPSPSVARAIGLVTHGGLVLMEPGDMVSVIP